MNVVFDFLSRYIREFCLWDNFYIGTLIFNMLFALVMVFFYQKDMKNYFICLAVRDEYLKVVRDKSKPAKASTDILISHGYSMIAPIMVPLMQTLFALMYGYGLRGIHMAELVVPRFPHVLSRSPFELMLAKETGVSYVTLTLVIVVFIEYYVIVTTEQTSLVNNRKMRMCILTAMISMAMLFPIGYCFALLIMSLVHLVYYKLVMGPLRESTIARLAKEMKYDVKAFNIRSESEKKEAKKQSVKKKGLPDRKTEEKKVEKKIKKLN